MERVARLALPAAAVLAVAAAVCAGLGLARPAGAVAGLALAAGFAGLHLRLGSVGGRLDRLSRRVGSLERAQADQVEQTTALTGSVDRGTEVVRRQVGRVRQDIEQARKHLDLLPSDTAYLQRLLDEIAADGVPLPALGGWAATARSVLAILDEIKGRTGPVTAIDCGSGASTVLEALLLRHRGEGGRVFALDADPVFAEETRAHLRAHGVADFGTIVDAPIVQTPLPDGSMSPWYDLAGLPDTGPVHVLFVDGPIGTIADQARYPAFPLLADRLAPGALVVLDDTNRPDEKAIVARWLTEEHAGRRLELARVHGRATLLRVATTS